MKSEWKVGLDAAREEILERVRWETGSFFWTLIGTTLVGGVTTIGGRVTIFGVVAILGCRLIDRAGALRSTSGAGVARTLVVGGADDGVGRSMDVFEIRLLKISQSLEMAVSCSWIMVAGEFLTVKEENFRA